MPLLPFAVPIAALSATLFACLWGIERREIARVRIAYERADRERRLLIESIETLPCHLAVFAPDGTLVAWNSSYQELHREAFAAATGPLSYADLMRVAARRSLPPEQVEADVAARLARHFGQQTSSFERLYPDGRWMRATKHRLASGYVAGFALDITEMKERERILAASEARYRALVDTASVGIWHLDQLGQTLFANDRLTAMFGGLPANLAESCLRPVSETSGGPFGFAPNREVEAIVERHGEATIYLLVSSSQWLGEEDQRSCVLTLLDITPLKLAQARLEYQADHDSLTGVGNRMRFNSRLSAALAATTGCTLLLLDLDHFKIANDTFGHGTGDMLLCHAASRMRAAVRDHDQVFRLGGDEFAVLIDGTDLSAAETAAARLVAVLNEPYVLAGDKIYLSASIGIARAPVDAATVEGLARAADLALYAVKRAGRNGAVRYDVVTSADRPAALSDFAREASGHSYCAGCQDAIGPETVPNLS